MLKGSGRLIDSENVKTLQRGGMGEAAAIKKMVSLKRSAAERKVEKGQMISPSSPEKYGYNTRMTLDHEMLGKLGMKKLPSVGDELHIHARTKVHSTSEDHSSDGVPRRRVELQMTHMGLK